MDVETLELIDRRIKEAVEQERKRVALILYTAMAEYSGYEEPYFDFDKSMRQIAYKLDPNLAP